MITTVRTGKELPFLYRWSLKKSKKILVNTNWWKIQLTNLGFDEDKIGVIYNPVLTQEDESEGLNIFNKNPDCCVFLSVQGFRTGKQHKKMLHAFEKVANKGKCELWLVGDEQ